MGSVKASYSITFYGVTPHQKELVFHCSEGISRIDVSSGLHSEEIQPEAKLKQMVQNYRPVESKIIALGDRHIIPPEKAVYELQLVYNFTVAKTTDITPSLPWLADVLYESEFISQFWYLYNSHKQYVSCGDAYASKWSVKVRFFNFVLFLKSQSQFSPRCWL